MLASPRLVDGGDDATDAGDGSAAPRSSSATSLLPPRARVLIVDADALFVGRGAAAELHALVRHDMRGALVAAADEHGCASRAAWYADERRRPPDAGAPLDGVNSGVLLVDLAAARAVGLDGLLLARAAARPELGDQDALVGMLAAAPPAWRRTLPCAYNWRPDFCYFDVTECERCATPPKVLHATRAAYLPALISGKVYAPPFPAAFRAFAGLADAPSTTPVRPRASEPARSRAAAGAAAAVATARRAQPAREISAHVCAGRREEIWRRALRARRAATTAAADAADAAPPRRRRRRARRRASASKWTRSARPRERRAVHLLGRRIARRVRGARRAFADAHAPRRGATVAEGLCDQADGRCARCTITGCRAAHRCARCCRASARSPRSGGASTRGATLASGRGVRARRRVLAARDHRVLVCRRGRRGGRPRAARRRAALLDLGAGAGTLAARRAALAGGEFEFDAARSDVLAVDVPGAAARRAGPRAEAPYARSLRRAASARLAARSTAARSSLARACSTSRLRNAPPRRGRDDRAAARRAPPCGPAGTCLCSRT